MGRSLPLRLPSFLVFPTLKILKIKGAPSPVSLCPPALLLSRVVPVLLLRPAIRMMLLLVVIAILVVPNAPFSESSPPHRRRIHHPTLLLLLLLLLHQLHLLLHALRGNKGVKCGATV
jgi:hypothetical protein